jgi:hypothetical protein
MPALSDLLTPRDVHLSDILLDPNNPRFAELGEVVEVPETRFAEARIQRDTLEKMKAGNFDVAELRDTIKTLGFLPMDRIVVRAWRGNPQDTGKYVVVEGNRRIAALKWLLDLHETGRETLSPAQIQNFTELEVLVLDDVQAPASAKWILPGLRHVSGIKEWGAYQKARAVNLLRESGSSPQEAAQSLGLSVRAANQLWRSYLALQQMTDDEEFGDHADPKLYSYFEEVFKRPNVRDWLQWSDNDRRFTNQAHLREFYGWMLGEPSDDGELGNPKLPEAKSVRELGAIIENDSAMAVFRAQDGTLARALARYEAEHPEDWKPIINQAETILASLSPDALRALSEDDLTALNNLLRRITQVQEDRQRLLANA